MGSLSIPGPSPNDPSRADRGTYRIPSRGHLLTLPTKAEVKANCRTIEAFTAEIPSRSANSILKIVDAATDQSNSVNLHHLRRFVTPDHLPSRLRYLRKDLASPNFNVGLGKSSKPSGKNTNASAIKRNDTDYVDVKSLPGPSQEPRLHFLICATSAITYKNLQAQLLSTGPLLASGFDLHLRTISIPLFPPTSEHQAKRMSQEYWPTVYRGGNPFGPHPAAVARATQEIQDEVVDFMRLATRAGLAASVEDKGEPVGAVVVDRSLGQGAVIIAAAGDARWKGFEQDSQQKYGNGMAHAVMRVIGLVAKKRRSFLIGQELDTPTTNASDWFAESPLTPLEKDVYAESSLASGGYLCLDLELYVTHEPCVMCCMAINHSRFGRVVFGERMPRTGGLTADDSSSCAYGLWWRHELNSKFLTWHWVGDESSRIEMTDETLHA